MHRDDSRYRYICIHRPSARLPYTVYCNFLAVWKYCFPFTLSPQQVLVSCLLIPGCTNSSGGGKAGAGDVIRRCERANRCTWTAPWPWSGMQKDRQRWEAGQWYLKERKYEWHKLERCRTDQLSRKRINYNVHTSSGKISEGKRYSWFPLIRKWSSLIV